MKLSEKLWEIEEHPNTVYARSKIRGVAKHAEALEAVADILESLQYSSEEWVTNSLPVYRCPDCGGIGPDYRDYVAGTGMENDIGHTEQCELDAALARLREMEAQNK